MGPPRIRAETRASRAIATAAPTTATSDAACSARATALRQVGAQLDELVIARPVAGDAHVRVRWRIALSPALKKAPRAGRRV